MDENRPIIDKEGSKYWFVNAVPHRDGAPATIMFNGTELWYDRGRLHREDGPAITYANGYGLLYLKNKKLTLTEYQHKLQLSDEFMSVLQLKYIFI